MVVVVLSWLWLWLWLWLCAVSFCNGSSTPESGVECRANVVSSTCAKLGCLRVLPRLHRRNMLPSRVCDSTRPHGDRGESCVLCVLRTTLEGARIQTRSRVLTKPPPPAGAMLNWWTSQHGEATPKPWTPAQFVPAVLSALFAGNPGPGDSDGTTPVRLCDARCIMHCNRRPRRAV